MNFCVKCGRDCEESLDGLCIDCWLDGRKLTVLPHHVDLMRCANCGEWGRGEKWFKKDIAIAVQDAAAEALRAIKDVEVESISTEIVANNDPYVYEVAVHTKCNVMGYETEDVAQTIVRIKNSVCKRCSRQLGNYYECILQIRTGAKELSEPLRNEALAMVENYVDKQAATNRSIFITKMEMVTGGVDVYLSNMALGRNLAKELADAYCGETKESPKLVGQTDDGQDLYRLTYLVRLPEYHVGDVVVYENRFWKLTRVNGTGGKVMDLMNFRERSIRRQDMPGLKIHAKSSDLEQVPVVSRSANEIPVLHPSNYSVVDLRVPEGFEAGDTVNVVTIDDVLYVVP